MEHKMIKVAIVSENDKCSYIGKVKTISEQDYAKYELECQEHKNELEYKYQEILVALENMNKTIQSLEKEIKVLKGEDE